MRFNEIMMIAFGKSPLTQQQIITELYEEMKESIKQLQNLDIQNKNSSEKAYLKLFLQFIEKMGVQLKQSRQRYQSLDQEKLKMEKCQNLANDIKIFRENCYLLKSRLSKVQKAIKYEKLQQDILIRQQKALNESLMKMKTIKTKNREKLKSIKQTLSLSTNLDNANQKIVSQEINLRSSRVLSSNLKKWQERKSLFKSGAINTNSSREEKKRSKSILETTLTQRLHEKNKFQL